MSSSLLSTVPPTKSARIFDSTTFSATIMVVAMLPSGKVPAQAAMGNIRRPRPPPPGPTMPAAGDPALDTLLLPFAQGVLAWPPDGGALFLRARSGAALFEAPR